jgi:hypothetical protein
MIIRVTESCHFHKNKIHVHLSNDRFICIFYPSPYYSFVFIFYLVASYEFKRIYRKCNGTRATNTITYILTRVLGLVRSHSK